jgi:cobalamin biosynthesis Co2+ chelatase CbiK
MVGSVPHYTEDMLRHQQRWKGHLKTHKKTNCIVAQDHTLGHPATFQAIVIQHLASILPVSRLSSAKAFGCAEILHY